MKILIIFISVLTFSNLSFGKNKEILAKYESPLMVEYNTNNEPEFYVLKNNKYQEVTSSQFDQIIRETVSKAKSLACVVQPKSITVEIKNFVSLTWDFDSTWCKKNGS